MKVEVVQKLGGVAYRMEFDDKEDMETLHQAIVLGNPKLRCNECNESGRDNFYLTSNKDTEGNIYVNCKCGSCGATSKLGRYKSGGYFWRDYEKYVPSTV